MSAMELPALLSGEAHPKRQMHTGNTMFAQLMDFLPWTTFARIVERYGGDRYVKSLRCAEHFRAMAFAQMTSRESLRDIEACLSAQASKLYHMGFREPIRRSTLSDANESPGLAHLRRLRPGADPSGQKALRGGELRGGTLRNGLCARFHDHRSVPVGFSVGVFLRHQGCGEAAYIARSARSRSRALFTSRTESCTTSMFSTC